MLPPIQGRRPAAPDDRLHLLDGLRALSALYVVVSHSWLTIYERHQPPRMTLDLTFWMSHGDIGVTVFIVLSGFSLTISAARTGYRVPDVRRFLARRFRRIVLPYWAALAVSVALATTVLARRTGTHWDNSVPVTAGSVASHVLLLQDLTGDVAAINHVLWSVALEWHIYFLFPLLLWLRRRIGLLRATGAVLVGTGAIWVLHALTHPGSGFSGTFVGRITLLGCFSIGMAAQEIAAAGGRLTVGRRTFAPRWGLLALVVGVPGLVLSLRDPHPDTVIGLAAGCLLVHLVTRPGGRLRRLLEWRPLVAVGAFSYSLYLLHAPVEQVLWQYVMRPLHLPLHDGFALMLHLAASLTVSVAVAYVFYRLVERRCMPGSMRAAVDAELAEVAGDPAPSATAPETTRGTAGQPAE